VLDAPLGDEPCPVAPGLWAAEVSGEAQAVRRVARIVDDAAESVPREVLPAVRAHLERAVASPGTVEAALLDRLADLVEQVPMEFDRLVVDSAPTGHMPASRARSRTWSHHGSRVSCVRGCAPGEAGLLAAGRAAQHEVLEAVRARVGAALEIPLLADGPTGPAALSRVAAVLGDLR
jgi:hypothetical protein